MHTLAHTCTHATFSRQLPCQPCLCRYTLTSVAAGALVGSRTNPTCRWGNRAQEETEGCGKRVLLEPPPDDLRALCLYLLDNLLGPRGRGVSKVTLS